MEQKFLIYFNRKILFFLILFLVSFFSYGKDYKEISKPARSIGEGHNEVLGVVLHHTESKSIETALKVLCGGDVSCHVVIDTDGTRYILADPEAITWHAGFSILNGREKCNEFTIGIEFQGDTFYNPLTVNQINSAIEYLIPIIKKYNISKDYIVTHEMIRKAWKSKFPDLAVKYNVADKRDISQVEYERFLKALDEALDDTKITD